MEKTMVWKNGQLVEGEPYTHSCLVCEQEYTDTSDTQFICVDCENEYAEWLDENGLVVGEWDDKHHPKYQPDALKGTKWEKMYD